MAIDCPHCGHKIGVKAAAGVYQPTCPSCKQSFVLVVPKEPGQSVVVAKSLEALRAKASRSVAGQVVAPTKPTGEPSEAVTRAGDASEAQTIADNASEAATVADSRPNFSVADEPATKRHADSAASGEPIGRLDGYELLSELGRGGMGCVYLARQVSLDRRVAVKTIHPNVADDPAFLARFVREAFAVAQLSHHNVVQIHDVGQHEATHYFSMELVPGRSLADVVKQGGPLDSRAAATYILHAARGLAFAHQHRMVHRDVKPANLLLSDSGLVKVADLGLVKTDQSIDEAAARSGAISGDVSAAGAKTGQSKHGNTSRARTISLASTRAKSMLGTPAFMAPEQADDAANVDHRADVYALGATFYFLLTGKQPFTGKTAREVIRNARDEPLVPPRQINPRIPAEVSALIETMMEKEPALRPKAMPQVAQSLERMLGIATGPFTPRPEHVKAVKDAAEALQSSSAAKTRRGLGIAFHAGCALMLLLGILAASLGVVSSAAVLWVVTQFAHQATAGLLSKDYLVRRLRRFAATVGWMQWMVALGGVVSFSVMMVAIGLQWAYLGALVAGALLGVGFYFSMNRWAMGQHQRALTPLQQMLVGLRQNGLEEAALRQFICKQAGRHWEQLYERLFGYEEKIEARRLWGYDDQGNARPRFGGWRDSIINWLDRHEQQQIDAHQRQHVQRMEVLRLRAEGVQDVKALAEARQLARDFADNAAAYRRTKAPRALAEAYHNQSFEDDKKLSNQSIEQIPESWKLRPTPLSTRLAYWVYGARGRFMLGSAFLAVYLLWATQREALPTLPESGGYLAHLRTFLATRPEPLTSAPIPPAILAVLSSPGALFAGLILTASGMFRGIRMTVFLLPLVIMLLRAPFMSTHPGSLGISPLEWTFLVAAILTSPAFLFGRIKY